MGGWEEQLTDCHSGSQGELELGCWKERESRKQVQNTLSRLTKVNPSVCGTRVEEAQDDLAVSISVCGRVLIL